MNFHPGGLADDQNPRLAAYLHDLTRAERTARGADEPQLLTSLRS